MKNYTEPPKVASTQQERLEAVRAARGMLSESKGFATTKPPEVLDVLRLAEYITTGHDYLDTHSDGQETSDE